MVGQTSHQRNKKFQVTFVWKRVISEFN